MFQEEGCILTAVVVIEGLVGGDENAGVLLRVLRVHFGGIVAESGLEIGEAVVAQLGPVAKEQSASHQAGVEDATQQHGSDAGLA